MLGAGSCPVRAGCCVGLAALLVLIGSESLQNATANGDTRTLSFHNTHTNEDLTVTFKVNGRYDEEALAKINHVLRDWREEKPIRIDPHLIDLIWEVYREVEGTQPIAIVCGYRSPSTNAMLRRRSSGVAKFSQHMLGKAMDFYIPGVPLEKLREAGLRAARGGVGFYPSSNFVHLDTGSVRHWPRMPEAQLARVMAKGPLTVAANDAGTKTPASRMRNPIAKLFGGGKDEEEDAETVATMPAASQPRVADARTQKSAQRIEKTVERPVTTAATPAAAAPVPAARPATTPAAPATFEMASASSKPVQIRPAQTASLVDRGTSPSGGGATNVISERGFWQGLPDTEALQTSVVAQTSAAVRRPAGAAVAAAGADPVATGSIAPWPARETTNAALAYAPVAHPAAQSPKPAATATARTLPDDSRDTTVVVKGAGVMPPPRNLPAAVKAGQRFNDPWLRAMIVAPSAGGFMSTSLLGVNDYRVLSPYLRKPDSSVMMTFAADPYLGMRTEKFAGTAVVFVSTITFNQRTAALQ